MTPSPSWWPEGALRSLRRAHRGRCLSAISRYQTAILPSVFCRKAIDLIDEACASTRWSQAEIVGWRKRSWKWKSRPSNGNKTPVLPNSYGKPSLLHEQGTIAVLARYAQEKDRVNAQQTLRQELEQARQEAEDAERRYELGRVAELRYGTIPALEQKLAEAAEKDAAGSQDNMLSETVTAEQIAQVVSRWTGIPVTWRWAPPSATLTELSRLSAPTGHRSGRSGHRGSRCYPRAGPAPIARPAAFVPWSNRRRKTGLAKALAGELFTDDNRLVRIDMSRR